jgi:hypothetical protein
VAAVPATLHASLMARLDRLGHAKQATQIGARSRATSSQTFPASPLPVRCQEANNGMCNVYINPLLSLLGYDQKKNIANIGVAARLLLKKLQKYWRIHRGTGVFLGDQPSAEITPITLYAASGRLIPLQLELTHWRDLHGISTCINNR